MLIESLGAERYAELRADGRRTGYESVLADMRNVVASTGAE
jgi:hypothetical protein